MAVSLPPARADRPSLVATYRLQLTPTFDLDDAAAVVPYLARLGISHVYTSSYLRAAAGSTHGYDTVDHATVSEELGGEDALRRFHETLRRHGLGNVIDVVPNHMSVADPSENHRWWNVLRDGPSSPDAAFFDIDWHAPETKLHGRVLLPFLGADYAAELASGAIAIAVNDTTGEPEIRYGEIRLPLAPHSMDDTSDLHTILERQHYRLGCWRVASDELNYRRFFDVTTLAGVRIEDPMVFDAIHERTLGWIRSGNVQGLRIDHPDGLRDPAEYMRRLRAAAPNAWIVIEKILGPGEVLPASWTVDGTTGYDLMRRITGVFIDDAAERELTESFERFVGNDQPYAERVTDAKRLALRELFGSEVTRLTDLAARCCEASVVARDHSRRDISLAVEALLTAMPVYRTYATGSDGASAADDEVVRRAVESALEIEPSVDASLFRFLGRLLSGRTPDVDVVEFVARFEQLSGPAMAKGVEDTVFYRYTRLLAANEVGADPHEFGITIEQFHEESVQTAAAHPLTMSSTSTHDTKRSEDVRIRIALLSQIPGEWTSAVASWQRSNAPLWNGATPDPTMEHLLYQTLVGAHPASRERLRTVLEKSMREAKLVTSWLHPSSAEERLHEFSDALSCDAVFRAELDALIARIEMPSRLGSLGQLTLKVLGPGVPDFYQGSELWTTTLVDPDNRMPVDHDLRSGLLDELDDHAPGLATDSVGRSKLWLTRRLLQVRAENHVAFVGPLAAYDPVTVNGSQATSSIAFTRGDRVLVVVHVRPVELDRHGWRDTTVTLPTGQWSNALDHGAEPAAGTVSVDLIAGTGYGVAVLLAGDPTEPTGTTDKRTVR